MNGVLQGTTPSLVIKVPSSVPLANVINLELTLQHKEEKRLVYLDGVTVDTTANTITYTFSETETMAMEPNKPLYWQLRLKNSDGIVGTLPEAVHVYDLLSEVIIP